MRTHLGLALVLVCLAMGAPRFAAAEDPPCLVDVKQFCADVPPGGGRVAACLKAHEAQVSPACRTRVGALQKEAAMVDASCEWDIAHFCSELLPGGGRVVSCLEKNKDNLSPDCLNLVNSMGKK